MAYAPTLTVFPDANPAPRVEVLFSTLPSNASRVTVHRLANGRDFKLRGAVNASVAGAFVRLDYEVPFGVDVSYRAEMFDSAGTSIGFTDSAEISVDSSTTWIHNPLDPSIAVPVVLERKTAKEIRRPFQGNVFYPQGRQVGVVINSGRQAVSGVKLECLTLTDADADKFASLFGSYSRQMVPTLCIRVASNLKMRLPRPFFAAVMDPNEQEFDLGFGGETILWSMQGDEVAPPAPGLVISLLTRADVNAYYSSRLALNNDNLTRLDVNRRYDLALGAMPLPEGTYEYPDGSGLYTTGSAVAAEPGLYMTDGFVEDPAGSGLYQIVGAS